MRAELTAALALLTVGCVSSGAGHAGVRRTVRDRIEREVVFHHPADVGSTRPRVEARLARPLDAEAAVEIALMQSPDLQASLERLDVALADVLRATLIANPDVELEATFAVEGNADPDLMGSFMFDLADAMRMPLRRAVADAELSAARAEAARAVLDLAFEVRVAFYRHQSDLQLVELFQQVVETLRASWEAAEALREAGNVARLDVVQQRALYEEARVALAQAELAALQSRERLQVLMGLSGEATTWEVAGRLGELAADDPSLEQLERAAIERSLDLEQRRHRLEALARRVGLARLEGVIPALHVGVAAEREEGEWSVGPMVEMQLPLFHQGQGDIDRVSAELRVEQHRYVAGAVTTRSMVRRARNAYLNARERAHFYRETLLPLREEVLQQSLVQYNAMNLGVFELLTARRTLIDTARQYVESLRDYWVSRAVLEQVLAGGRPEDMGAPAIPMMTASPRGDDGGH